MKIKLLDRHCKPHRAYPTDSGLDLRARLRNSEFLQPMWHKTFPTGIAIKIPEGCEGQIRPRSGLAKRGILAAFGTVDNDYIGEIKVTLINTSMERIEIKPYERIAQLVIAPVIIPKIEYVAELDETQRGENGHGSTGRM
jgi:dUTP pyrophosphatase